MTNFSFTASDNKLYFFSGFKYEKYSDDNLYEFLTPKTSRDKIPEFGRYLIKVDLDVQIHAVEGPEELGGYIGSMILLNDDEMIYHCRFIF